MEHPLTAVVDVVLPVFLCISIGVALARLNVPFDRRMVGRLVQTVGYPTLILAHLSAGHVELAEFATMLGAAAAMVAAFAIAAVVMVRLLRLPLRSFAMPLTLGNVGNIGLPVASLAFGHAGLAYAFAFLVVVVLGISLFATYLASGSLSLRAVATSPIVIAVVAALVLLATGTALPKPLASAATILGGMSIPLMLLTLGHTLAGLSVGALRLGATLTAVHLAVVVAVGFGFATLFGFTGVERGVFVVMATMPPSVATYLIVEANGAERSSDVASFVFIATLMTVVVLPAVLAFAG